MHENDVYINSWALNNPFAASSYVVTTFKNNGTSLQWKYGHPALVDHRIHAGEFQSFTKEQFRRAHAYPSDAQKLLTAFNMDYKSFHETIRLVEVGTHLYVATQDKILQAVVRIVSPGKKQVPDIGEIPLEERAPELFNLRIFNRAAGVARGDIMESAARELIQKMHMGYISGPGDIVSINFGFNQPRLNPDHIEAMNKQKVRKGLINKGLDWNVTHEETALRNLQVNKLTEIVWSKTTTGLYPILPNRVVTHSPNTGEIAVDTVNLAVLPHIDSSQLVIRDGATDIDGHLLDRLWELREPHSLYKAMKEGTITFTPPLEKVIARTPDILAAIRRFPDVAKLNI